MVSDEGSLSDSRSAEKHIVIVTYWKSFEAHARSHAGKAFKDKFAALAKLCVVSKELGYDMLWQGGHRNRAAAAIVTPASSADTSSPALPSDSSHPAADRAYRWGGYRDALYG